jgi:diguanylate cyclase (GGDEF)-like protein
MRSVSFAALIAGVILIPTALGFAKVEHDRDVSMLERRLSAETVEHADALDNYFARARAVILLTANSPAFADVLAEPGTRAEKVRRQSRHIAEVTHQMRYLETLYPQSIGEACFIDRKGEEFARVVRGKVAPVSDLSTTEKRTVFFKPTFALRFGQVHQTHPYVSPDTHEWVVANASLIPQPDGRKRAFVHFEVTVESFRRAMAAATGFDDGVDLRVIDSRSGRVIIDGTHPQRIGEPLGEPGDGRFAALARTAGDSGVTEVPGRRAAYRRIAPSPGNTNDWIVVATMTAPAASFLASLGVVPIAMLVVAVLTIVIAGLSLRARRRELEEQAATDELTGLGNRRQLMLDLERRLKSVSLATPFTLTIFDLNGFKQYNDTFGHAAGDALLVRLGHALGAAIEPFRARAYRQGGDEFCVIADAEHREAVELAACAALSDAGDGFEITTAFGTAVVPLEARDASEALRRADEVMYAQKQAGRTSAGCEISDVLLQALSERHPDLGGHMGGVAELAAQVGERLGIEGEDLVQLRHAAALHDIGKVAIPDAIITKPGPLDAEEWAFMRRHTLIGERIIAAAPSLAVAARLVRASHERWDGGGYPDAVAGDDIPFGARVIAVCDAFDAMISARPYAPPMATAEASAELRRCAGTQFDPAVVDAFERVLADRALLPG